MSNFKEKLDKLKKDGCNILEINGKHILTMDLNFAYNNEIRLGDYYLIDYNKECLYKGKCWSLSENIKIAEQKFNVINLNEVIKEQFRDKANLVIKEYVKSHIDDLDYFIPQCNTYFSDYTNQVEKNYNYKFIEHFQHSTIDYENSIIDNKVDDLSFSMETLLEKEYMDFKTFEYDVFKNEIVTDDATFLDNVFGNLEKQSILASYQYRAGKTPTIYNKLKEVKEFMEDKKTINIILDSGSSYKARAGMGLFDLPRQELNKYWLDKSPYSDIPLSKIHSFRFGKKDFIFEPKDLSLDQIQLPILDKYYSASKNNESIYLKSEIDIDINNDWSYRNGYEYLVKEQKQKNIDLDGVTELKPITKEEYEKSANELEVSL